MENKFIYIILGVLVCTLSFCPKPVFSQVASSPWLFQLQDGVINEIATSGFDIVVIDYSKDGSDFNKYTSEEIETLVNASITPIAYFSIGEAEDYRFYWKNKWVSENRRSITKDAPTWLGQTNKNWPGNYKVRYWNSDWQENYLKPYMDKIIAQGFKGLYLDIVDAFEYWYQPNNYHPKNGETRLEGDPYNDREDAAQKMIELVVWMAEYCRENSPYGEDFLIIPQNGECILNYDDEGHFFKAVSGIGAESVWYTETKLNEQEEADFRLNYLRKYIKYNKMVLVVDYVDNGNQECKKNNARINDFVAKCQQEQFRYYIGEKERALDKINYIEGVQP